MKTKIAIGLVMALALGALATAPVGAEPGKGQGQGQNQSKGTTVVRGTDAVENDPCESSLEPIVALEAVTALDGYKWRWVYKKNGRPSKLFCRFKGADMNESVVDPPDRPKGNIVRYRGEAALTAGLCPTDPDGQGSAGELRRARFKMNAKGNGLLKCVYSPPAQ